MISISEVRGLVGPILKDVIESFGTTIKFQREHRGQPQLTTGGFSFQAPEIFTGKGVIVPVSRRTRGYDQQFDNGTLLPNHTHVVLLDPASLTGTPQVGDVIETPTNELWRAVGVSELRPDGGSSMITEIQVVR